VIDNGDKLFHSVWPGNTTPQAADGTGTAPASLCGWCLYNVAAAVRYVRFFNGQPTMGTSTPNLVVKLPASGASEVQLDRPPVYPAGLWISVTNGEADNDNTAPTASDVVANVFYQT
jgi:hypothetical protein